MATCGYVPAGPDFLKRIREITREQGILLILDEVQSLRVAHGGEEVPLALPPLSALQPPFDGLVIQLVGRLFRGFGEGSVNGRELFS